MPVTTSKFAISIPTWGDAHDNTTKANSWAARFETAWVSLETAVAGLAKNETISGTWTFSTAPILPGNSIPETAIADGAILARAGAAETISGSWTFATNPTFNSSSIPETAIADGVIFPRIAVAEVITGPWSFSSYVDFPQQASPPNPPAGTRRLFTDAATGTLKVRTSSGGNIDLETGGVGGGVTDHGDLTGLADDDHPMYAAHGQTETISDVWTFSVAPVLPVASIPETALIDGSLYPRLIAGETITGPWVFDTYIDYPQRTAPASPAAGTRRLYMDSGTGKLSVRTSAGSTVSLEEQSGPSDHGTLTGLGDDDHPQYAAIAQTETISAAWTFSSNPVFNSNSIPETAIAGGALLARVGDAEVISGAWTFSALLTAGGNLQVNGQGFSPTHSLTDGATITPNFDNGNVQRVTLAGNRALANPTNMKDGGSYTLIVNQDVTGGRTLTYGTAYKWPGGAVPVLSTGGNAVDILSFVSDGTNMFGTISKQYQ